MYSADTDDGTVFVPKYTASVSAVNSFIRNQFPNITDDQLNQIDEYYPKGAQYDKKGTYFSAEAAAYGDMVSIRPQSFAQAADCIAALQVSRCLHFRTILLRQCLGLELSL